MTLDSKILARKFAMSISHKISESRELKNALKKSPFDEHKLSVAFIMQHLEQFLEKEFGANNRQEILFDFEGDKHRRKKQERSYAVLGTSAFPDSALLKPFRCAFEFDRETFSGSSRFKSPLMKAAVHVLSGAYDACVLVFVMKSNVTPFNYLGDNSSYTNQLVEVLQEYGLFITFVTEG